VAVGQEETVVRQAMAQCAHDARVADAGLGGEHGVPAVATRLDEGLHGGLSTQA
jgi:hypothetical protein